MEFPNYSRPSGKRTVLIVAVYVVLFVWPSGCWPVASADSKVLLRDVQVLTLRAGQYTTGRRASPVPQLKCVGGSAGCRDTPEVVQCYNRGSDGRDAQWECKAEMKKTQKFGFIQVSCEGYDFPDDPYILVGSCGLEYSLEKTDYDAGGSHRPLQSVHHPHYGRPERRRGFLRSIVSTFASVVAVAGFVILVLCVCCLALAQSSGPSWQYSRCPTEDPCCGTVPTQYVGPGHNYGGGWTGWGAPSAPLFGQYAHVGHGYNSAHGSDGPGFWTGAATGGLLGYLFGDRHNPGPVTSCAEPVESQPLWYAPTSTADNVTDSLFTHVSEGFGGTARR